MMPCYDVIPEITLHNIQAYAEQHVDPGDFLLAVLQNDLREAFGRADDENIMAMFHTVAYCWNHIPAHIWGSREAVDRWLGEGKDLQKP